MLLELHTYGADNIISACVCDVRERGVCVRVFLRACVSDVCGCVSE